MADKYAVGNVERITPDIAEHILANNVGNRRVAKRIVQKYAAEMKSGNWKLNYEPIVISKTGKLLNGQHRLLAVVESGVSVDLYVIRGADDDTFLYDRGYTRSEDQAIYMMGVNNCTKITLSIAKLFFSSVIPNNAGVASTVEIIAFLNVFKNDLQTYQECVGAKHSRSGQMTVKTNQSVFGLACVIGLDNGMSKDEIHRFLKSVRTGFIEDETETSAIIIRNMILADKFGHGGIERIYTTKVIINALEDYHNKKPRKTAYKLSPPAKSWIDQPKYGSLARTWKDMTLADVM